MILIDESESPYTAFVRIMAESRAARAARERTSPAEPVARARRPGSGHLAGQKNLPWEERIRRREAAMLKRRLSSEPRGKGSRRRVGSAVVAADLARFAGRLE